MNTHYKINEMFYSLQGEGVMSGMPALFIRFAGCNLSCGFCDTKFDTYDELSKGMITNALWDMGSKARRVVMTGGEPMLQVDEDLLKALMSAGLKISIETNGTILIPDDLYQYFSIVTVSPKLVDYPNSLKQIRGTELKVVYQGQSNYELETLRRETRFSAYCLQPCSMQNINECVEFVKGHPDWQLSFQLQKVLNIR